MQNVYELCATGKRIGYATVEREGLYYHIVCKCKPESDGVIRVKVNGKSGEIDLGICFQRGNSLGLETKLPIKRVGEEIFGFKVVLNRERASECFIPIQTGQPFAELTKLQNAKFAVYDDKPGIIIIGSEENN